MLCFFWVKFWLGFFKLAVNSVPVTKFTCDNFAVKAPAARLLTSRVVIYLSWLWSVRFFSISLNFVLLFVFFYYTAILFSTPFNAEVVGKPLILVILPSNSVILALQSIF